MFNDVILIHRHGAEGFRQGVRQNLEPSSVHGGVSNTIHGATHVSAHGSGWYLWQTCLRKIAFGSTDDLPSLELKADDEIHRGADAYRLCLEIICGLHSPLVGETEVFGQFKNAVESWMLPESPWGLEMRKFIRAIFEDAKRIRSAHLNDLGSQSYGSLLRRELKSIPEMHVLGGGHLTGEILPWLCKDGTRVVVHVRSLARAQALREQFPEVEFCELPAGQMTDQVTGSSTPVQIRGALIVAAPVSAAWLSDWMQQHDAGLTRIADLRGDADVDSVAACSSACSVLPLSELMQRISDNQEILQERREIALDAIAKTVASRARHIEYRPFGWEDVCA